MISFAQLNLFGTTAFNLGVHSQRSDMVKLNSTPRSDVGMSAYSGGNNGYAGDTIGGHTIKYVDDEDVDGV
jgi:hypothetical protein